MSLLKVDIPAKRFDELAVAWIKHRGISTRSSKYTLEELLDECDFKWPITEDELIDGIEDAQLQALVVERLTQDEIEVNVDELGMATCKDIEAPAKRIEVTELRDMFKSNTHVSIEDMRLEFENIFDAMISDKNEAITMKSVSDMIISMRSVLDKYNG